MRPQPVIRRVWLTSPLQLSRASPRSRIALPCRLAQPTQTATIVTRTRSRPTISFHSPTASISSIRKYASEQTPDQTQRRHWLRYEFKLLVRYFFLSVGAFGCIAVLYFFYLEETRERDYPTPHEWTWTQRKLFRDAHKWADPERMLSWNRAYHFARNLCLMFEDEKKNGGKIPRIHNVEDPNAEISWEFIPHDISGMSEEWRRGYFDAIMLAAKAAGHCDGFLKHKDPKQATMVWEPKYVIGPSNPRPTPIPPRSPPAPREEDCIVAFPPADQYYLKILATKGFSQRQRMQALLEYANFTELKRRPEDAPALYNTALAIATEGMDQTKLPFNPKTLVLKEKVSPPSANILDALTALANNKARNGDTAAALPIYISLLKARRSLSDKKPLTPQPSKKNLPLWRHILEILGEPPYPAPPPDGTQPPWRSPEERCQEASLTLYIGEILYAMNSHEDGIAWTREGVDISEEQLRGISHLTKREVLTPKARCRECLKMGLDNWSVMVTRLASDEKAKKHAKPGVLSFWSGGDGQADGRWEAEGLVVLERMKRTLDLVEDVKRRDKGPVRYFTA